MKRFFNKYTLKQGLNTLSKRCKNDYDMRDNVILSFNLHEIFSNIKKFYHNFSHDTSLLDKTKI